MRRHYRLLDHPQFVVHLANQELARPVPVRRMLNAKQYQKMVPRPDMLLQLCHFIAQPYGGKGVNVEVRVRAGRSLNGRPKQRLVDPNVNLAAQPRTLMPVAWMSEVDK